MTDSAEQPLKLTPNELLAKHGPAGWLVRKLQAYALLGWILFGVTLTLHFVTVLIGTIAPRPIVAVDASGRVLGTLEYLSPTTRSDQDILAASMRFADNYLSLNSATIFNDYAAAMNMMGPDLLKATEQALHHDTYLARIAASHTHSWIDWAEADAAPRILSRHGLDALVRLRGTLFVEGPGGQVQKPFDMALDTRTVARNSFNTAGIEILARRDN